MVVVIPDAVVVAILSIFLFLALCAALALVVLSLRRPRNIPLAIAAGIIVLSLVIVVMTPQNVPGIMGMILALPALALSVLGGDPVVRRVLDMATHGTVQQGIAGGILVGVRGDANESGEVQEILRGGTTIGYLERVGVTLGLIAGFPEAIAVVVALKGIGRFSELSTPAARERFIVGTLASLLWACVIGALVRLAIW
ncbi:MULTISPECIES: hypothetical protein [unclassified Microbacterium]|uniref:hypothetical protein n=1 Tax=unclassified Microbacterium TaxID=2609290 RepID=UPI00214B30E0|nr:MULTISPECIES: hypothetical protein [unclassified Microbacterium]MCR2784608.1 hypothetical protein [Microbacterium sp. zg.B96]MDL5353041.1 hypothetical protein [Microbacterium sp. zg-YB36]WIM16151.1 hypothetical protein QNO11_00535 [Microbacterium sp. zg-B96]